MNYSELFKLYSTRSKRFRWFVLATAALLAPSYLLITCLKSYAVPREARVVGVTNNKSFLQFYTNASKPGSLQTFKFNQIKNIRLRQGQQLLSVPRLQTATLEIGVQNNAKFRMAATGGARYSYVCKGTTGNLTLKWSGSGFSTSPCPIFKVKSGKLVSNILVPNTGTLLASNNLSKTNIAIGEDQGKVFYCSAFSESASSWGFDASNSRWDLFSPNDPCNKAFAECNQVLNDDCSVVNLDEISVEEQNLTASLQCNGIKPGDPKFTSRILRGSELINKVKPLKDIARDAGVDSCMLNVYAPDELNFSPIGGKIDSINVYEQSDRLIVIGLAGKVLVTSTQVPQGVEVEAGEIYIYNYNQPPTQDPTLPSDVQQGIDPDLATQVPPGTNASPVPPGTDPDLATQVPPGTNASPVPPGTDLEEESRLINLETAESLEIDNVPFGGIEGLIPPNSVTRSRVVTNSPSISAFLAENNWQDAQLGRAAVEQQFLLNQSPETSE